MAFPRFPIRNPTVAPSTVRGGPNGKVPAAKMVQVPGPSGTYPLLVAEVAEAWLAFVAAAAAAGFVVTHTGCYRPYDRQVALFLERHYEDPSGPKVWDGRRWRLRPGMANAAIPGTSPHGLGCAIDMALDRWGKDAKGVSEAFTRWAAVEAHRYGFAWSLQSEPWHIQWVAGDDTPEALRDDPPEEAHPPENGGDEEDDGVRYLYIGVDGTAGANRPSSIVALDGSGVTMIPCPTIDDANKLIMGYAAVQLPVSAAQYDVFVARSRGQA